MYVPSGNPSVVIPESGKVTFIDFVKAPDNVIFVIVSINCSAVTPTDGGDSRKSNEDEKSVVNIFHSPLIFFLFFCFLSI